MELVNLHKDKIPGGGIDFLVLFRSKLINKISIIYIYKLSFSMRLVKSKIINFAYSLFLNFVLLSFT